MKQPLVSIITPSYNQAHFLEETILSVLNQTYAPIEYIVIDGGSEDGSKAILEKYKDRFAYQVSEKDNGQSNAINKGFAKSTGEIVAYLNSDDLYAPDAVERIVRAYTEYPGAGVYYGTCNTIDEKGKQLKNYEGSEAGHKHFLEKGMLPNVYQPACFFVRDKIGRTPVFREDLHYVMDMELLLWISSTHWLHFINHPIASYRVHEMAKTSEKSKEMYAEKLRIQLEYGTGWRIRWKKLKFNLRQWLHL